MNMQACKACGKSLENASTLTTTEQMYGLGGSFSYSECATCHSLTLQNIPANLAPFYPTDYYSFDAPKPLTGIKKFIKRFLAEMYLFGHAPSLGLPLPNYYAWIHPAHINETSRILDVGCGAGHLLMSLASDGLENLVGVDPFITESKTINTVQLLKQDIFATTGEFDVIIFNHSLEHVADPMAVLGRARELLSKDGVLIVRLPITSTHAFKTYGAHWVQLDAPRHLWIPTVKGFKKLVEQSGLSLESGHFDSTAFQFWGSTQYQKGIPLMAEISFGQNPSKSIFSKKEIAAFEKQADELNTKNDGDSATFYLHR